MQINTLINKDWGSCKYFRAFNIVLFKQILLQIILWSKYAHSKEQDYNGFSQINIPFKFSWINHRPLFLMNGCSKCYDINSASVTYESLQLLPWNNDIIIEKIDSYDWCLQVTDFFQYRHQWNIGVIIFSNYDVSLATTIILRKHNKFERIRGCNCCLIIKKWSIIEWEATTRIC